MEWSDLDGTRQLPQPAVYSMKTFTGNMLDKRKT